jgi:hypothetical protein
MAIVIVELMFVCQILSTDLTLFLGGGYENENEDEGRKKRSKGDPTYVPRRMQSSSLFDLIRLPRTRRGRLFLLLSSLLLN